MQTRSYYKSKNKVSELGKTSGFCTSVQTKMDMDVAILCEPLFPECMFVRNLQIYKQRRHK